MTPFEWMLICHDWSSFAAFLTILTDQLSFCNTALLRTPTVYVLRSAPLLVAAAIAGPDLYGSPVGGASPGHIEAEA